MESRKSLRRRRGSLIIEAVISVTLLATATFALTKLSRSAAVLSQHSDQRLAATLAAENTIERLRDLTTSQITENADEVAQSVSEISQCKIEVTTAVFAANGRNGVHVQVDASPSRSIRVTLHDWRLAVEDDE